VLTASSVAPIAPKAYWSGTHRLVSPEQTLAKYRRFFPVMGITRIVDVTHLDTIGIPVVMVCRPNSRSLAVSQGKALDLMAARVSGVMESIESFMAERIDLPLFLGSFDDLRFSHSIVDVDALPRTTTSPYRSGLPILWIEGRDVSSESVVLVPYEMVHTAYTLPAPSGTGCFVGTSNGLASGNHHLEALSHAICETVERDATTLHALRTPDEIASRRIDLTTIDDPDCREALDRIERAGVSVGIWNTTTDIGIPAFKCMISDRPGGSGRRLYSSEGMGCHPAREIALLRAITEAAQSRLTYISGTRDDLTRYDYALAGDQQLVEQQQAILAAETALDFTQVPTFMSDSFDADVEWELARLRAVGITDVIAVDLSREEFGIPVVRVVVPGLEGPTEKIRSCRLGARAQELITR
jgi:YcaO-like protein with predicted kinase domain